MLKSFILMLTFLTRIPIKVNFSYEKEVFFKGIIFMPFIGFIIGLLIFISNEFILNFDKGLNAILLILIYIYITGGIHLDGLSDTCDGIFSNRRGEKLFQIMKDSNVGAFGVISIVMMILLNIVFFYYLPSKEILIGIVFSRSAALVSCSKANYPENRDGMGRGFIENSKFKEGLFAILFLGFISILLTGIKTFLFLLFGILIMLFITKKISNIIGGITGDNIGFLVEVSQILGFFILYII